MGYDALCFAKAFRWSDCFSFSLSFAKAVAREWEGWQEERCLVGNLHVAEPYSTSLLSACGRSVMAAR